MCFLLFANPRVHISLICAVSCPDMLIPLPLAHSDFAHLRPIEYPLLSQGHSIYHMRFVLYFTVLTSSVQVKMPATENFC